MPIASKQSLSILALLLLIELLAVPQATSSGSVCGGYRHLSVDRRMSETKFNYDELFKTTITTSNQNTTTNAADNYVTSNNNRVTTTAGPSLYEPSNDLSILNDANFDNFIYSNQSDHINLVQFYNFHCPHCQGFAPHFRRFVRDIRHWKPRVKIGVLNCADSSNVQLCRDHEPKIRVPTIKWYAFGSLLSHHPRPSSTYTLPELLSVSHRALIPEQRRDLVSLRHGTIEFMERLVGLRHINDRQLTEPLAQPQTLAWHLFMPLNADSLHEAISIIDSKLNLPNIGCRTSVVSPKGTGHVTNVQHLAIVVEKHAHEYLGAQIVADWSDWVCEGRLIVTRTHDQRIRSDLLEWTKSYFGSIATHGAMPQLFMVERRLCHDNVSCRGQLKISNVRLLVTNATVVTVEDLLRPKQVDNTNTSINYDPNLFKDEERLRWRMNNAIADELKASSDSGTRPEVPGHDPDSPKVEIDPNNTTPIPNPANKLHDDEAPLVMTDYYKTLSTMIGLEALAKGQLDGFQVLTIIRLMNTMVQYFPFERPDSRAQLFLKLARDKMLDKLTNLTKCNGNMLHDKLTPGISELLANATFDSKDLEKWWHDIELKCQCGLPSRDAFEWKYCAGSAPHLRGYTCGLWLMFHTLTVNEYAAQHSVKRHNHNHHSNAALPRRLRRLWGRSTSIESFPGDSIASNHQMLVNRVSSRVAQLEQLEPTVGSQIDLAESIESSKRIKQQAERDWCDTESPERDLFGQMTSRQKFIDSPDALASVVNFVRFFFGCDNCAGHFSCMVKREQPLSSGQARNGDHVVWLWQVHNKVNLRTKNTHSEDRVHPKHVFPVSKVCPCCYKSPNSNDTRHLPERFNLYSALSRDKATTDIEQFDVKKILDFMNYRYASKAIQHNKINIEQMSTPAPTTEVTSPTNPTSGSMRRLSTLIDQNLMSEWMRVPTILSA